MRSSQDDYNSLRGVLTPLDPDTISHWLVTLRNRYGKSTSLSITCNDKVRTAWDAARHAMATMGDDEERTRNRGCEPPGWRVVVVAAADREGSILWQPFANHLDPAPGPAQQTSEPDPTYEYDLMEWHNPHPPRLVTKRLDEIRPEDLPDIVLMTATEVERDQVLRLLGSPLSESSVLKVSHGPETYYLGRFGAFPAVLSMCAMGTQGPGSANLATYDAINTWSPIAIVMVGIAFGSDRKKHLPGDVLVADSIAPYESQRVGEHPVLRTPIPPSSPVLLNRFRNPVGWEFTRPDGTKVSRYVGQILSGEKLVDNPQFKEQLRRLCPTALGGEMEGAGLCAAANRGHTEWILVKAVCDWADGLKHDGYQELAAAAAASLVLHVLSDPNALHGIEREGKSVRSHAMKGGEGASKPPAPGRGAPGTISDLWRKELHRVQQQLSHLDGEVGGLLVEVSPEWYEFRPPPGLHMGQCPWGKGWVYNQHPCEWRSGHGEEVRQTRQVLRSGDCTIAAVRTYHDLDGRPIVSSNREPVSLEPGLQRHHFVYGDIQAANKLIDLAKQAGAAIRRLTLPQGELSPEAMCSREDDLRWFYLLHEIGWKEFAGISLHAQRMAWYVAKNGSPISVPVDQLPHFRTAEFPKELSSDVNENIPDPPTYVYSELPDLIVASASGIDVLMSLIPEA